MAVTITHPLLPVHFSRNPVEIEFSCPDKFITAGKFFRRSFAFGTYPTTDGATFTYTYTKDGVEIPCTFTFRAAPDPDLQEILIYPGSGELDWVTNHLIPGLLANPNIAEDFMIGMLTPPTYLFMDALFYSTDSGAFSAVSGCLVSSGTPGGEPAIPAAQPNYRLSAWLYVGDGQTVVRTREIETDADSAGKVKLDVQAYADALLNALETPTDLIDQPVECTEINKPAYILYGQKWGDILERKKNYRSPIFRLMKGGMEDRQFAGVKNTLTAHLSTNYLTLRRERTLRTGQKDWLYWLCPVNTANVRLRIDYRNASGTGTTYAWLEKPATAGRTYQFRIDPAIWASAADLISYTIYVSYLSDGNFINCQSLNIKISDNYLDQVFEFENTFGARESICFTGQRSIAGTVSKSAYSTHPKFNAAATDTTLHTTAELVGKTITCSTGALTRTEALSIIDFLRSRHIWYITPSGNRIPVRIPKADALIESINREANYARGAEFTAELGVSKNVSSEIV